MDLISNGLIDVKVASCKLQDMRQHVDDRLYTISMSNVNRRTA